MNPMDHLWWGAKADVSTNRQYDDIDEQADEAERWVLTLTPRQAKRKAGILSKNFWLLTNAAKAVKHAAAVAAAGLGRRKEFSFAHGRMGACVSDKAWKARESMFVCIEPAGVRHRTRLVRLHRSVGPDELPMRQRAATSIVADPQRTMKPMRSK